jgi:hypothetical protein
MPCFGPLVRVVYPPTCDPFANRIVSSDFVEYNGDNLSCTGIQNCDTLTVALQKIDNKICSDAFVAQIIQTIANDPVLSAYFCQLVNQCALTTTTTTTAIPATTTTTTTGIPVTTTTTTTAGPTTTTTTTTCIARPENLIGAQLVTNVDYTDVTVANSCALFVSYQSSGTMDPISVLTGGAEYEGLSIGQAIYLGVGETNCTRVDNGVYWIYPSLFPEGAQEYFYSLSTTAITVITVAGGIISDIDYCFGGGSRTTTTTTTLTPPTYTRTLSLGFNAYTSQPFPTALSACDALTLQSGNNYVEGSDIVEPGTTIYRQVSPGVYAPLSQAGWYKWSSDYIGSVDVPHTPPTVILIDYTGTITDIQAC